MKRLLALICGATLLLAAGAGTASAAHEGPGPNGSNDKGLCTAYFNGQKNGHEKQKERTGEYPGPFAGLEEHAEDSGENEDLEDEQQISDDVFEFCQGLGIGGNPEQNGRFDCREGDEKDSPARDEDTDGEIECVANSDETV